MVGHRVSTGHTDIFHISRLGSPGRKHLPASHLRPLSANRAVKLVHGGVTLFSLAGATVKIEMSVDTLTVQTQCLIDRYLSTWASSSKRGGYEQ